MKGSITIASSKSFQFKEEPYSLDDNHSHYVMVYLNEEADHEIRCLESEKDLFKKIASIREHCEKRTVCQDIWFLCRTTGPFKF